MRVLCWNRSVGEGVTFALEALCCDLSPNPSILRLCRSLSFNGMSRALEQEIQALQSEGARAQRLGVRWRLRLHIQLPPVLPRPSLPARRRVLFVLCCYQRLYLPPELAFCVLQMLTLGQLGL